MSPSAEARPRRCATCHATYLQGERFCPLDGGAVAGEADAGDPNIGLTIDERYFVRRLIGRGGMGVVYEAEHVGLDKRVAIKFLSDDSGSRESHARFRREARAASRVSHEHVVQIFDVGSHANMDYIVMEYVEGSDLRELLRDGGAMEAARVIAIGRQILLGLEAIHRGGIVHRDIKPANILIEDRDGSEHVKIMDFGISKWPSDRAAGITESGQVMGTPQFMAPEQIAGGEVDHRADLYAVGITLYALATGSPPFTDTEFTRLVGRHLLDHAPALHDVPECLGDAVARALRKDPAERFATALEFATALGAPRVADTGPGATRPARPSRQPLPVELASTALQSHPATNDRVPQPAPASSPTRRRWWVFGAIGSLLAIALVLALYVFATTPTPARPAIVIAPEARAAEPSASTPQSDAAPDPASDDTHPVRVIGPDAGRHLAQEHRGSGSSAAGSDGVAKTATLASLALESTPSGASIFLDGKPAGETPTTLTGIVPGRHVIRLERAGHEPTTATIELAAGEHARSAMTLRVAAGPVVDHTKNPYPPSP